MVQVTFNLDAKVLSDVDKAAKERELSRSRFIAECIAAYFAPKAPKEALTNEAVLLTKDLTNLKEIIAIREGELKELKETNGRLWAEWHEANTRLLQYQLPAPQAPTPKKSWWVRHFGSKE
jgi:hypothetical protein